MFLSVEIPRRKWLDTAGNMAYQHPGIGFLIPEFLTNQKKTIFSDDFFTLQFENLLLQRLFYLI
jgi:hypothetical protein